eukprot:790758-Alexandrium_andersonii.AAC.2
MTEEVQDRLPDTLAEDEQEQDPTQVSVPQLPEMSTASGGGHLTATGGRTSLLRRDAGPSWLVPQQRRAAPPGASRRRGATGTAGRATAGRTARGGAATGTATSGRAAGAHGRTTSGSRVPSRARGPPSRVAGARAPRRRGPPPAAAGP